MVKPDLVPFKPENVTIYRGRGRAFEPGSLAMVPRAHLSAVQAADRRAGARKAPNVKQDAIRTKTSDPAPASDAGNKAKT
jgi:hypothetical protein